MSESDRARRKRLWENEELRHDVGEHFSTNWGVSNAEKRVWDVVLMLGDPSSEHTYHTILM